MNEVSHATGSIPTSGRHSQIERSTGTSLDYEQFLTLMVAQLENQDPLEPMSNQEFAAQMAQFAQLERLASIDTRLEESLQAQVLSTQAVTNTMAAGLIGKEMMALGSTLEFTGGSAALNISLSAPAEKVIIRIFDAEGNKVRTIRQYSLPGGANTITWDGTNDAGDPMANGTYGYEVEAISANDTLIDAVTSSTGIITGVSYEGGVATLLIGNLRFSMGDVISISMPGGSK